MLITNEWKKLVLNNYEKAFQELLKKIKNNPHYITIIES